MKLYPDLPRRRTATIAADVALVLAVLLLAWLGSMVHDSVQELTAVSDGVQEAGGSVERSLNQAGDAVGGAPIVGGQVRDALKEAGQGTGGRAVEAAREGERGINDLARLLGWLTFLIPAGLLLSRYLPPRIAQVRKLTGAARVLDLPESEERRRLLAQRAAFGLPYATLLQYTDDPLGDLEAGRLGGLVAAVREDAGLAAPTRGA
jgi:hypothetical protein